MLSHWARDGEIPLDKNGRMLDGKINYKNTSQAIVLVREIEVSYSAKGIVKFAFYPDHSNNISLLKDACISIFTHEERKNFISPTKVTEQEHLYYLKIEIDTKEMRKKLISFCQYINDSHSTIEFSKSLVADFESILSGKIDVALNQNEFKQPRYHTPAYINSKINPEHNFGLMLKNPEIQSYSENFIELFRNGFNPNYRDINGATFIFILVVHYIENRKNRNKEDLFNLIKITLIYGGNLFELDNGAHVYCSAASRARENATEILDLIQMNIKTERPLKVTQVEHKIRNKILETKMNFDNKTSYDIRLMTINEFNKQKLAPEVFELFKHMHKNSDPEMIKAEFEGSFANNSDDDNELTMVLLILFNKKIVGFTVYDVSSTLTVDYSYLLPEINLGGAMAFLILSLGFSLYPFVKEFFCYAAHYSGYNVFKRFKPFSWPQYNIEGIETIVEKIIKQSEDQSLSLTYDGIGIQKKEKLKVAGEHKITGLEQWFFYEYIMGGHAADSSAMFIVPVSDEFQRHVIDSAFKIKLDFLKLTQDFSILIPKISSKIPDISTEYNMQKRLTLPKSHTLFAPLPFAKVKDEAACAIRCRL